jgi:hypothetical protein
MGNQIKKSGGWDSSYGGREFKSSGGKVQFTGQEKGKGTTPIGPAPAEGKKGQVNFLGAGGNKGMVTKGKGSTSKPPISD